MYCCEYCPVHTAQRLIHMFSCMYQEQHRLENRLPRLFCIYFIQLLCISSGNLELFDTDGECILQSITQAVGSLKQYGRWCIVCPYREWPPTRGGSLHSSSVEQLCLLWSHPRFLPPGEGHQLINSTGTYLEVVLLKQPFFELANACKCHRITFVDWNCDSIQLVPHMLNYVPTTFQKLRFFC